MISLSVVMDISSHVERGFLENVLLMPISILFQCSKHACGIEHIGLNTPYCWQMALFPMQRPDQTSECFCSIGRVLVERRILDARC